MLYISKTTLRELNTTQASLIKMNLKVSKYAKSSPLLDALRVESIKNLYNKFKILFVKQLRMIPFTKSLLEYLDDYYYDRQCPNESFIGQIIDTNRLLAINVLEVSSKSALTTLKKFFQATSEELKVKILNISSMMSENKELLINLSLSLFCIILILKQKSIQAILRCIKF